MQGARGLPLSLPAVPPHRPRSRTSASAAERLVRFGRGARGTRHHGALVLRAVDGTTDTLDRTTLATLRTVLD